MKEILIAIGVVLLAAAPALAGQGLYSPLDLQASTGGLFMAHGELVGYRAFGIAMLWIGAHAFGLALIGYFLRDMLRELPRAWRAFWKLD